MKIRVKKKITTANQVYNARRVIDVNPRKAEAWIKRGLAEAVKEKA